jgi:hypothetical protein
MLLLKKTAWYWSGPLLTSLAVVSLVKPITNVVIIKMTEATPIPMAAKVKLFLVFSGVGGFGVGVCCDGDVESVVLGGVAGCGRGEPWRMLAGIPAGRCGGLGVCSITKLLLLLNYSLIYSL